MVPLHRLRKDQLVWLCTHRCEAHRHLYVEHYNCYLREHPEDHRKIGFLDIEASNLKADFGYILSWCILDNDSDTIACDVLTKKDLRCAAGLEDKRVVKSLMEAMSGFDEVVTYYGTNFDIPFTRTRALITGQDYLHYGTLKHTDLYYVIRNRFQLSRSRQETACRQLIGDTEKSHFAKHAWLGGPHGDKKSLDYILDHNKRDVRDLKRLYHKVLPYMKKTERSI